MTGCQVQDHSFVDLPFIRGRILAGVRGYLNGIGGLSGSIRYILPVRLLLDVVMASFSPQQMLDGVCCKKTNARAFLWSADRHWACVWY